MGNHIEQKFRTSYLTCHGIKIKKIIKMSLCDMMKLAINTIPLQHANTIDENLHKKKLDGSKESWFMQVTLIIPAKRKCHMSACDRSECPKSRCGALAGLIGHATA